MFSSLRLVRISRLAVPIVAGALATNLMGFIDTIMVGQLGDSALAGVGIGGQLFFLLLAILLGLAAGVQALVARRVGEDRIHETGVILNGGIFLAALISLPLVVVGYLLTPALFALLNNDPNVIKDGVTYLSTRMPSLLIIGINIAFRSYWVGVSLAKWSMVSIIALSLANVLFNYALIFGNLGAPQLGIAGAGLGSTLATAVGLLVNIAFAFRLARPNGFVQGLPDKEQIWSIVKLSYPESLRQAFFTVGVLTMYVLVGYIGTNELAAFHVVINICLLAYMLHIGVGGAATTLVGEAVGRRDLQEASGWGWQVSNVGLIALAIPGLIVLSFPEKLLSLFLTDSSTLLLAVIPLQLAVVAHVLDGYSRVLGSSLIGAGATSSAMKLTLLPQWIFLLPLLSIAVLLGYSLTVAMALLLVSTSISAVCSMYVWRRGRWQSIGF